jgi:protein-tyrosine phosphatase
MIDLHSHILPGIDDGSPTLTVSLEMARLAVKDGIRVMACTPHIYPGLYMNDSEGIERRRAALQKALDMEKIPLKLVAGADVHLVPEVLQGLRQGRIPTLHGSRYVLIEPSHNIPPPRLEESVFSLVVSGYTPIITHPERLNWIDGHHDAFVRMIGQGAWMQITADALTGLFGTKAKYWAERMVGEGHAHILASDAHSVTRRIPRLSAGLEVAAKLLGPEQARYLVLDRPKAILDNLPPSQTQPLPRVKVAATEKGWLQKQLSRLRNRHDGAGR